MTRLFSGTRFCFSVLSAFAQGGEIAPNENLVAEGIPKIPASLAESASRYSEFRSAGFSSWNPAEARDADQTRFADTSQVHQVKFPGGARTQLTFFPDRSRRSRVRTDQRRVISCS